MLSSFHVVLFKNINDSEFALFQACNVHAELHHVIHLLELPPSHFLKLKGQDRVSSSCSTMTSPLDVISLWHMMRLCRNSFQLVVMCCFTAWFLPAEISK